MPVAYKKCQRKSDQPEIKKVEHYRKNGGNKDLPLIYGQRLLLIEELQHDDPPVLLYRYMARGRRTNRAAHVATAGFEQSRTKIPSHCETLQRSPSGHENQFPRPRLGGAM